MDARSIPISSFIVSVRKACKSFFSACSYAPDSRKCFIASSRHRSRRRFCSSDRSFSRFNSSILFCTLAFSSLVFFSSRSRFVSSRRRFSASSSSIFRRLASSCFFVLETTRVYSFEGDVISSSPSSLFVCAQDMSSVPFALFVVLLGVVPGATGDVLVDAERAARAAEAVGDESAISTSSFSSFVSFFFLLSSSISLSASSTLRFTAVSISSTSFFCFFSTLSSMIPSSIIRSDICFSSSILVVLVLVRIRRRLRKEPLASPRKKATTIRTIITHGRKNSKAKIAKLIVSSSSYCCATSIATREYSATMEHTSGEYGKGNQISKLCGYIYSNLQEFFSKKHFTSTLLRKDPHGFFFS